MFNYRDYDPSRCEFVALTAADDLPPGERLFVEIDARDIVVFNIAGQFFAIQDKCSHEDLPLGEGEVDEEHLCITCPYHGAEFDLRTGKALSLPAVEDIPAYPVRVRDGMIEVGLPLEDE